MTGRNAADPAAAAALPRRTWALRLAVTFLVGAIGGWLFDHWASYGPFVMVGCGNVVVFSLALILLRHEARRRKAQAGLAASS